MPPKKASAGYQTTHPSEGSMKTDDDFTKEFGNSNAQNRFPTTPHLMVTNKNHILKDDKICKNVQLFCGGTRLVYVEEKIDAANLGISLDSKGGFRSQHRGGTVDSSHPHYKALDEELREIGPALQHLLRKKNNDIIYGEFMPYCHQVEYDCLPARFVAFDIFDWEKNKFLSRKSFHSRIREAGLETDVWIPVVPMVDAPRSFTDPQQVVDLYFSRKSHFGASVLEGVYLRVDEQSEGAEGETYLEDRSKLVRADFQQHCDQKMKGKLGITNSVDHENYDRMMRYRRECLLCSNGGTEAFDEDAMTTLCCLQRAYNVANIHNPDADTQTRGGLLPALGALADEDNAAQFAVYLDNCRKGKKKIEVVDAKSLDLRMQVLEKVRRMAQEETVEEPKEAEKPDFSGFLDWLTSALAEEGMNEVDAQSMTEGTLAILEGGDEDALTNAAALLEGQGAPKCAAALAAQWARHHAT